MISLNSFDGSPVPGPASGPASGPVNVDHLADLKHSQLSNADLGLLADHQDHVSLLDQKKRESLAKDFQSKHPGTPHWVALLLGNYAMRNGLEEPFDLLADKHYQFVERFADSHWTSTTKFHLLLDFLETEYRSLPSQKPGNMPDPKVWTVLESHFAFVLESLKQLALEVSVDPNEARKRLDVHRRAFPPRVQQSNPWWIFAVTLGIILDALEGGEDNDLVADDSWAVEVLTFSPRIAKEKNDVSARFKADKLTYRQADEIYKQSLARHSERMMRRFCEMLSAQVHWVYVADAVQLDPNPTSSYDLVEVLKQGGYHDLGTRNGWGEETPELLRRAEELFFPVQRVWNSPSGSFELFVCHYLKFYYSVYSD